MPSRVQAVHTPGLRAFLQDLGVSKGLAVGLEPQDGWAQTRIAIMPPGEGHEAMEGWERGPHRSPE